VPEPSYAERARTLVHLGRTGALATLSRRHPGHPFASVMPYAVDDGGQPLFLISTMAMHTQNLAADARASLLVTAAAGGRSTDADIGGTAGSAPVGGSGATGGARLPEGRRPEAARRAEGAAVAPPQGENQNPDPLATGRVTLMGRVEPVPPAEGGAVRAAYLARHPSAAYWVDFEDFAFHRLAVRDVYYVGGFAAMDWVDADGYRAARPDPLADAADAIIAHMNRDHADALRLLARAVARVEADEVTMVSVDRLGFKVRVRSDARLASARIPFTREVATADQARTVLIEMVHDARTRTSA
jgi:putative heme iron utilization protein